MSQDSASQRGQLLSLPPEHRRERVAVVGSGIAGLSAALAFGNLPDDQRPEITVFERDAPPDFLEANEAFADWKRPGVTHLRHSHVFLARLYNLIRDEHPRLLDELLQAGCRELRFVDGLPATLRDSYRPIPQDDDFTILSSRRTTLELVMRRYVVGLGRVTFRTAERVHGLVVDAEAPGPAVVRGLRLAPATVARRDEVAAALHSEAFDVVIDATGKQSQFAKWLGEVGVEVAQESAPAGILYLTRHYRLRDGQSEPERGDLPGNGDLGYFKFGAFPADNGNFSITVALPEDEPELRIACKKEDGFQAACMQCPGIARWVDPARSRPVSKVFGMGGLVSHWKQYVPDGKPLVHGFFAVGDSVIRSNPLYGRGCSSGAIQAHLLADAMVASRDPHERAVHYAAAQEREIRPHYESMKRQDLQSIQRAERERDPDWKPSLKQRLQISFFENGLRPATRADVKVLRAFMRGFHMLEDPTLSMKDPAVLLRIVAVWLRPSFLKRKFALPKLGPERDEMFEALGI